MAEPSLQEILDTERVADAGAVFGQVAASTDWGGIVVASARFVEYDVRAPVVLVPALFRLDVTPLQDTLGVAVRALTPHRAHWSAGAETFDVLRTGSGSEPLQLTATFELPENPLVAEMRVLVVNDVEAGGVYVAARAAVGRAEDTA